MAIFGKIDDLSPLFSKTEELEYLYLQICSLFKPEFLSRIQTLNEGENFETPLEYGMFFITHCYKLRLEENGFFESHQKYIDFQVVLEGFERYLIGNKGSFTLQTAYDPTKDLEIHTPIQPLSHLILKAKEMCILFPQDVHGVGIGTEKEIGQSVKKAIFKVPLSLIKHRL